MENVGIYKAISAVMADIGAVKKEKEVKSNSGGYKFRGIDDVMNALHPAMVKHKVFIVPEIVNQEREKRTTKTGTEMTVSICKIRYTFFCEDGSFIEATVIGEGMDNTDKATNKAMAIAFKYACFQVFCIPTEEMIDPDSEIPGNEERQQINPASPKLKAQTREKAAEKGNPDMIAAIQAEMARTGITEKQIIGMKQIQAKTLKEVNEKEFKFIMEQFKKTPSLEKEM